jgi:RimJ/RimL family protein N-acetyltransferase
MDFDPRPILLENRHVRLEPLTRAHLPALVAAASSSEIFQWFLTKPLSEPAAMTDWFEEALRNQAAGTEVAFATVRASDGRVVGSTRFMDLRRPHRALEIGNTWLAPEAQRTAVNTAAKYLMLRHAFEAWGAVRVQLKTDERNERSRAAIARLGAVFEGVLRNYQTRTCDGYVRNTAMFSITDREWPGVKTGLEARLAR